MLTRSRVASIVALDGYDATDLLALAERARGIESDTPIERLALGSAELLAGLGVSVQPLGDWPERLRRRGEHVHFLAVGDRLAGCFGVTGPASCNQTVRPLMENDMLASWPISDQFPDDVTGLPNSVSPSVVTLADGDSFTLRIAPVAKRLGASVVRMLAYNGSVPGPTLRVAQGSQLVVQVVNDGDLETTVHWHGLRLDNRYDGTTVTQRPIPVGGTFIYQLSFPDPGIYWYHPHIREDYGQEVGLSGTIVVVPSDREYWPAVHREVSLTLDDILLEHGRVAPFDRQHPTHTAMGRFGDLLLANGEPEFLDRARQGEVVRFYLTNTANTRVFNVAFTNARVKRVGGDSGRCEREEFVENVVLAPSERAVLDVLFDQPGTVKLEHRTPDGPRQMGTIGVTPDRPDASLLSRFAGLRSNAEMVAERRRTAAYLEAAPDKTLALVAEMAMEGEPAADGASITYVCPMHPAVTSHRPDRCPDCGMKLLPAHLVAAAAAGQHGHAEPTAASTSRQEHHHPRFNPVPAGIEWEDDMVAVNRLTTPANMRWKLIDRDTGAQGPAIGWQFSAGDRVKIRLINELDSDHPMHHPFHMHGAGRFLILSRDGVPEPNLVWKDTVLVPKGQRVDLLLELSHPGVWMAHCHIAEHHESGMMLHFQVHPRAGV